jgi:uncharacterized protein (TIGR02996 family)
MLNPTEATFLRSIAKDPDDNTARLVFADWLQEQGDAPRAEFIRTQCELSQPKLAKKKREAAKLRERDLLNEHRAAWCETLGLPVEDVHFERGLVSRVRLPKWSSGKLLDPAIAPRFLTVTELDLSDLQIGDPAITTFAKSAEFPALQKLILSENKITDAGAAALAAAKGMPKLETVYLFGNATTASAGSLLETSTNFSLTNVDLGVLKDGYSFTPGQTDVARRQFIRTQLQPALAKYFEKYERLQSAMLCVAQYWADEADDAVHNRVVVSELVQPTLKGVGDHDEDSGGDPNIPNTPIIPEYYDHPTSAIGCWELGVRWDDNNGAIPLWAAFAPEEGSQEYDKLDEVYSPAVILYRHGGYEILRMPRPYLDGIRSSWSSEIDE